MRERASGRAGAGGSGRERAGASGAAEPALNGGGGAGARVWAWDVGRRQAWTRVRLQERWRQVRLGSRSYPGGQKRVSPPRVHAGPRSCSRGCEGTGFAPSGESAAPSASSVPSSGTEWELYRT